MSAKRPSGRGKRGPGASGPTDRGQAYTLEGFASAAVVLIALLLAMQSVVIAPGSGGVDRTSLQGTQQEAQDALVVASHANATEGNLSELVRYWAADGELDPIDARGTFEDRFVLGQTLNATVTQSAVPDDYRVEFVYLNGSVTDPGSENATDTARVVGSSTVDPSAVTASYRVPVFEHQNLTTYDASTDSIVETDDSVSTGVVPDAGEDPVRNVVEVRVTVW